MTTTQPGIEQDPSVPQFVTLFTDVQRPDVQRPDVQAICRLYGKPLPTPGAVRDRGRSVVLG